MATDKTLTCSDCGNDFVFTAGEQDFYRSKGFTNEPKRCIGCRNKKREHRENGSDRPHRRSR